MSNVQSSTRGANEPLGGKGHFAMYCLGNPTALYIFLYSRAAVLPRDILVVRLCVPRFQEIYCLVGNLYLYDRMNQRIEGHLGSEDVLFGIFFKNGLCTYLSQRLTAIASCSVGFMVTQSEEYSMVEND